MPFLVLATLRQNKRVIRYLLSQGVEGINVRDEASGNTPLHYAIMMLDGQKEEGAKGGREGGRGMLKWSGEETRHGREGGKEGGRA